MAAESSFRLRRGESRSAPEHFGYLTLFELARGGMGTVELAVRSGEHFSRLFAIKRLNQHFAESDEARASFMQEGRVAALLRHPSAVSVLDVGEDENGPYLVMEYVEGASVSALITSARARGELLPVQICMRACLHAAQGLHAAHDLVDHRGRPHGFLHRDVSPANILVGYDGLARVTDFGVAQTLYSDKHTFSGTLKGKLRYMAPERLRFEKSDQRSDIFSLGVVLYEMLSGEHLFAAEGEPEIAQQVLHAPTPDIGLVREGVPLGVVELLFEMLAKDPVYRPPTAAAVAERLDALLTELEFEQGKVCTDAYLEEQFGKERRERQQRVRDSLEGAAATVGAGRSASQWGPAWTAWWRRRRVRVGAALIALLALGVGVAAWPRGEAQSARPETVRQAAQTAPARPASRPERSPWPVPSAPGAPLDVHDLPLLPDGEPDAAASATAAAGSRPAGPGAAVKRPKKPRPDRPQASPCDPPFYYDAQGVKRVRRECF